MEGKPAEFADCDGNSQLNNLFVVEKIQKITTTIRLQRHFNKEENELIEQHNQQHLVNKQLKQQQHQETTQKAHSANKKHIPQNWTKRHSQRSIRVLAEKQKQPSRTGGSSSATARRRRQRKNKRLEVADMKEKLCAGNPLEGTSALVDLSIEEEAQACSSASSICYRASQRRKNFNKHAKEIYDKYKMRKIDE
ncbi:hypothetical protein ACQ4LE_003257 [Meloidogyne hapla]